MAKKKKGAKKKTASRLVKISFKCAGGCVPSKDPLKIYFDDTVEMKAIGTNVEVRFPKSSPFKKKVFDILAGTSKTAKVVKKKTAKFPYKLTCGSCPTPATPPQMIID